MVYVMLGNGFEEIEAVTPIDLLRRAGNEVLSVGINGKTIIGSHGIPVVTDITLDEMDLNRMDMIVIPGGLGGVASIRASRAAMDALHFGWENQKYVGAVCAGPTVLADLGITDGKEATCYPGMEDMMGTALMQEHASAVIDGKLVTGTSAGCAIPFALALIRVLNGEAAAADVAAKIVIR